MKLAIHNTCNHNHRENDCQRRHMRNAVNNWQRSHSRCIDGVTIKTDSANVRASRLRFTTAKTDYVSIAVFVSHRNTDCNTAHRPLQSQRRTATIYRLSSRRLGSAQLRLTISSVFANWVWPFNLRMRVL